MESAASGLSPSSSQHYLSTLDFLSLAGIDGSAEAHHAAAAAAGHHAGHVDDGDAPLDDPSPIALESRTSSGAGHPRNPVSPAPPSHTGRDRTPMDIDAHSHSHAHHHSHHASMSRSAGAESGAATVHQHSSGQATPAEEVGDPVEHGGSSYDALQAGMLQHQVRTDNPRPLARQPVRTHTLTLQLEQIHMQSPMVGATNPTSPYSNMASMFLTSPPSQSQSQNQNQHGGHSHSHSHSHSQSEGSSSHNHSQSQSELARSHYQRKYNAAADAFGGVLTPGV